MKTHASSSSAKAFTLIEMIGVIAIIAIFSVIITPTALLTIDRAFVRAERENMKGIANSITEYARRFGYPPSAATWNTTSSAYNAMNPNEVLTNRKNVARRYIIDPTSPGSRVIVVSGMRAGLTLPSQAALATVNEFNALWNTAENAVPATATWAAWTNYGEHLVIERINLWQELRTFTITLKNQSGTPGQTSSYAIRNPDGSTAASGTVTPGNVLVFNLIRSNQRIDLYTDSAFTTLSYSYLVSSVGKTFEYNGSLWISL